MIYNFVNAGFFKQVIYFVYEYLNKDGIFL